MAGDAYSGACNCELSDAWRCAVKKGLTNQVSCHCPCHRRQLGETGTNGPGPCPRGEAPATTITVTVGVPIIMKANTPLCPNCGQLDVRIPRMGIYHVCPSKEPV